MLLHLLDPQHGRENRATVEVEQVLTPSVSTIKAAGDREACGLGVL